jgi:hypothetical protein
MPNPMSKPIARARIDAASTNITTSAFVELVAELDEEISMIEVYDTTGKTFTLAVGAAASEVENEALYLIPNGNGKVPCQLPIGARVSVKAIDADATTGVLIINFFK